ncbi:MAG: Gfo/Idh/MocA family oxidoreductase [Acidobacteriota bacterium]
MTESKRFPRRKFLQTAGLAAASLPALTAKSYAQVAGANDRLHIGLIGCGGMARSHLNALLAMRQSDNLRILAVADVYQTRARNFQDRIWRVGGNARAFTSYRDLLDVKDLDYVVIATPEHWHARQALDALDAGHHLYCEKPITHSVASAHQVLEKVRSSGLKMQVGVQGMSDDSYSSANRAIREGKLGPVVEAQIDYVRNYSADRGPWRTGVDPNLPKPSDLDWEAWLGPAPKRPWSPPRFFEWRNYRDYSGGIATDLFIHRLTRLLKACSLKYPTRVTGMGGIYMWNDGRDLPDNFEMLAEYPAVEGITPGMTVHLLGTMANAHPNPHLIRGKNASLVFEKTGWRILEERTGEVLAVHKKTGAEDVTLHHRNLQGAIRSGAPLRCPAELGVYGLTAVSGANQSWFEKRMLTWDEPSKSWS